jgi:hypothetical protein
MGRGESHPMAFLVFMAIDFDALLKNPQVRGVLRREGCVKAFANEDYLPNVISKEEKTILTLSWDGNSPVSGAHWITEWQSLYFFKSSDLEEEGPYNSLDEILGKEEFSNPTAEPELTSKIVPLESLLVIGKDLAGEEGCTVAINDKLYQLVAGQLREVTNAI